MFCNGTIRIWTYHNFIVDGPHNKYTLHIGGAEGPSDGRDCMVYHNGLAFSTYDYDNDNRPNAMDSTNCIELYGGW